MGCAENCCGVYSMALKGRTIPARLEPLFPGDQELERRIKSLIRWNALAMVVRANRVEHNIGGHISTYASAATLYAVGYNHFFRARSEEFEGDTVYFQGHASPGIYARAYLEGRISAQKLENFRRELKPADGYLSGALQSLSGGSRDETRDGCEGVGIPGRWRDGRAGIAWSDHAGVAREAGQFDFRGQLQFAAARWAGARQRADYSRAGIGVPWRGLERD